MIVAAFVLLAICYAYATPIFEAPDENTHVGFVEYVATTGQLPVQVVGEKTRYAQEGSQPPLYYWIVGLLTRGVDWSDFDAVAQPNPHAIIGNPSAPGNQNSVLHDDPYPPRLSGTTLGVFIGRAVSILCGAITVFAVYQCGRVLAPEKPSLALLAAGLTAFNPQFLFISASVNNDNLIAALDSLVIWQLLILLRDGFSARRSLILALLIALAALTKVSALVLVPVIALAALWIAWRRRAWRGLFILGGLMASLWALIAGWWYVRNLALYGEFTGTQRMLDIFGRRPAPPLQQLLTGEFTGLRMSYWGLFGWFNVFSPQPFYVIMDAVSLIGVIGLALAAWTMPRSRLITALFLALTFAAGLISLIAWTSQTAASQGRLMFPFVAAISCLLALGLSQLRIPALLIAPLAAFALAVPFVIIMPTYAPPAPLSALPASATPVYAQWKTMALVGYEVTPQRYQPGDSVPITLYWKPTQQADADYSLFIRLLDPTDNILVRLPSYPGFGRLRTSTWQPGVIYPDYYTVRLPASASGQFALRAYVGWWKFPEGTPIDPVDEQGRPIAQVIFPVGGLVSPNPPAPTVEHVISPVNFGGAISLVGYTLHGSDLTLLWQATASMSEDYTVFVQALLNGQTIEAQGDAPPLLPTSYWRSGERYTTQHHLTLAPTAIPGTYTLYVGWYSTAHPQRLAVDAPGDAYPLTSFTIPASG